MATTTQKLKVEYRKVEDLIPYARNARTHSDEQIAKLAASIREFGWTNPILIDGENGIIAGHGRLAAARKLNMTEVPCIELSGLTVQQKKALILADNRLSLDADWDNDLLKLEIEELSDQDFDLALTGFDEAQINTIVNGWESDIPEPSPDDDEGADEAKERRLTILIDPTDYEFAKEAATNALEQAGIDYSLA